MPSAAGKVIFITSMPSAVGAKTTVARFSSSTSWSGVGPGAGLPGVGVPYEAAMAVGLCRVLRLASSRPLLTPALKGITASTA
eukprot:7387513-Prymnesium_polylepis.2